MAALVIYASISSCNTKSGRSTLPACYCCCYVVVPRGGWCPTLTPTPTSKPRRRRTTIINNNIIIISHQNNLRQRRRTRPGFRQTQHPMHLGVSRSSRYRLHHLSHLALVRVNRILIGIVQLLPHGCPGVRAPTRFMLTKSQKKAFVLAVRDHADILFAKFDHTTGITKKRKDHRLYLVGLGAEIPDFKMVRDCEWSNVKRASLKRHEQVKNGEEGVVLKEWDDMVVDIVQRVQGGLLDAPSSSSSFRASSDQKPVKLETDHEGGGGGNGGGAGGGRHGSHNYSAVSYGGNGGGGGGYDQDLSNNSDGDETQ
ncbi:hypothetical protein TCAL_16502 [Tigriopus californicus]|uniref:Uncharacterized protein n=1 Tax=Tigriopus californicus TaxID=6832 RepID=A0A553NUF2_TIGCA|nr:hypothetical protein TCAL_16502 [Tigriopus californicus]